MKVERDIGAVDLVAAVVGTGEVFLYLYGQSSILLPVLQLVQLEVFLLQGLNKTLVTSSFSTSA